MVWKRPIEAPLRRTDQMEGSLIVRGRGRPKKNLGSNIKRESEVNALFVNLIHGREL